MKTQILLLVTAFAWTGLSETIPDAVPEPGLILYGTIRDISDTPVPVSNISMQIKKGEVDTAVIAKVDPAQSSDGTPYYRAQIPFHTLVGSTAPSNSLPLPESPTDFNVSVDKVILTVKIGEGEESREFSAMITTENTTFPLDKSKRGAVERLDLEIKSTLEPYSSWSQETMGFEPNRGMTDDFDGDGFTNEHEWIAGTDPTKAEGDNPLSNLTLESIPVDGTIDELDLKITPRLPDRHYQIFKFTDLQNPTLVMLPMESVTTEGEISRTVRDDSATEERAFYRVEVTRPMP